MTGLALGGPAPDFTLRDQFGQDVTLSSYQGSKAVVIFFYPAA
ncbi:MAG: redoxin domain-containing protein, partial [Actinomycetota bacterium]|nr:redoxin domain-containing protein [Actinomycetota bacterium]